MSAAITNHARAYVKWLPEWDALLGKESDNRVALRVGVSPQTVRHHRITKGVPPSRPSVRNKWQPEWDEILRQTANEPGDAVAKRLGVSYGTVRDHRLALGLATDLFACDVWREEWNPLLGTLPDCRLAVRLGVDKLTVSKYRKRFGIRRFSTATAGVRGVPDADLLPDRIVETARRTDFAISRLSAERRRRHLLSRGAHGSESAKKISLLKRAAIAGMVGAFGTEVTLAEMGEVMGVTRERIRQLLDEVQGLLAPLDPHEEAQE